MRELALQKKWLSLGASFRELAGSAALDTFGDIGAELRAIRNSAAVSDFSFCGMYSFPEAGCVEFLDSKLAANIFKLRYGKIRDTFLADDEGKITAETLLADIDDKIFVVSERLRQDSDAALPASPDATDLSPSHSLLSVDGPESWRVVRSIFGSDIFNIAYLSCEKYEFQGADAILMRNGRTGEFGYQILISNDKASALLDSLLEETEKVGGRPCGFSAHSIARMEGNFFNIFAEGKSVGDPLELGLQWMADFSKENFDGSKAILAKRKNGGRPTLACFEVLEKGGAPKISIGDPLYNGEDIVGRIVAIEFSPTLRSTIGLASFIGDFSLSGFLYSTSCNGEQNIRTISRPAIYAKSLDRDMEQE